MGREFIIHIDHQSLIHFKTQKHVNKMHARWAAYFGAFHYVIKHKAGHSNKVPNALSRRATLLITVNQEVVGLNSSRICMLQMMTLLIYGLESKLTSLLMGS